MPRRRCTGLLLVNVGGIRHPLPHIIHITDVCAETFALRGVLSSYPTHEFISVKRTAQEGNVHLLLSECTSSGWELTCNELEVFAR